MAIPSLSWQNVWCPGPEPVLANGRETSSSSICLVCVCVSKAADYPLPPPPPVAVAMAPPPPPPPLLLGVVAVVSARLWTRCPPRVVSKQQEHRAQVRNRLHFLSTFEPKHYDHVYQDRLGTHIGKAQLKKDVLPFSCSCRGDISALLKRRGAEPHRGGTHISNSGGGGGGRRRGGGGRNLPGTLLSAQ